MGSGEHGDRPAVAMDRPAGEEGIGGGVEEAGRGMGSGVAVAMDVGEDGIEEGIGGVDRGRGGGVDDKS